MGKNPIIPYLLIMALGLGLIFFMSLYGLEQKNEIAEGDQGNTEDTAEFDPEAHANAKCVACHGQGLEGGGGPALVGTDLSKDELIDVMKNGIPPAMPGGLVPNEHLEEMADYILSLK